MHIQKNRCCDFNDIVALNQKAIKISAHLLDTFKSRIHPTVDSSELSKTWQGCHVRNGIHNNEAPLGDAIYSQSTLQLLASPLSPPCATGMLCRAQTCC